MAEKIEFHPICVEDREWMNEKLREEQPEACEYGFVNNFIWRNAYEVEVAQICGCGLIRYQDSKGYRFSYPFGNGDKKAAIETLKAHCLEEFGLEYKLDLYPITDKHRNELITWFPGQYIIDADRDDFDYIYLVEDLASLKGKKYHGKRNHIARFMDDDDWSYEPLTAENLKECRGLEKEWVSIHEDKWEEGVNEETIALQEAFDHYEEFGLVGGLIRKGGKVVAFTIGEPMNDQMMVVHFEKAYPDLQGAYPMINQQFILHECGNYKYVNREEDVGDPGLRRAKLSYYPEILLRKYNAVASDIVFANEKDIAQIKLIWQTCFGDGEDYIRFYLAHRFEVENMLVIHEDGKPVSMATFLPALLKQGEEWAPVRYVYAVATLPEYRGKGYASRILKYASEKYKEPLILQPEGEELERFYEKLGFVNAFEKKSWEITASGDEKFSAGGASATELPDAESDLQAASYDNSDAKNSTPAQKDSGEVTLAEYKEIRDAYFDRENYVSWDEDAITYVLLENDFCGGRVLKIEENILLYRLEKNTLRVVETTLEGEALQSQIQKLLSSHQVPKAVYENKGGMIKYPEGMEKPEGVSASGYLNLTLG